MWRPEMQKHGVSPEDIAIRFTKAEFMAFARYVGECEAREQQALTQRQVPGG